MMSCFSLPWDNFVILGTDITQKDTTLSSRLLKLYLCIDNYVCVHNYMIDLRIIILRDSSNAYAVKKLRIPVFCSNTIKTLHNCISVFVTRAQLVKY